MLSPAVADAIVADVENLWEEQVTTEAFASLTRGKEVGHHIADYVDDLTCEHLDAQYKCARERDGDGVVKARSYGDTFIADGGIYNPVNVKSGLVGREGMPNIVALKKIARALADRHIDSYWLLFVKVDLDADDGHASTCVDLVNIFDYLDYVRFDSGTGQLMLAAKKFIAAREAGEDGQRKTVPEILDWLYTTLEDGDRRLVAERNKRRAQLRQAIDNYNSTEADLDQKTLHLG